jgi:transposase-like protein
MAQVVSPNKRNEIIAKIRHEGMTVPEVSRHYSVTTKTIYRWLRDNVGDSTALEINRLKRENEQLYTIIGKITAELKRSKG